MKYNTYESYEQYKKQQILTNKSKLHNIWASKDEMINNGTLSLVKYIGEPEGNEPRLGRKLIDWEGVICQINNKENSEA